MILKDGQKWACKSCVTGHRSSKCTHSDRELYPIAKKGRPSSHCKICRDAGLSGSSTELAPPGCTCQAKRQARSGTGSAPGSISPDDVSTIAAGEDGSSKRKKNSNESLREQAMYSGSSHAGSAYSDSSRTSSPGQSHTEVSFTQAPYPQYNQDAQFGFVPQNLRLPDPPSILPDSRLSHTTPYPTPYPHFPQAFVEPSFGYLPDYTRNIGNNSTASTSELPLLQPRPHTAELPWWMHKSGFSPKLHVGELYGNNAYPQGLPHGISDLSQFASTHSMHPIQPHASGIVGSIEQTSQWPETYPPRSSNFSTGQHNNYQSGSTQSPQSVQTLEQQYEQHIPEYAHPYPIDHLHQRTSSGEVHHHTAPEQIHRPKVEQPDNPPWMSVPSQAFPQYTHGAPASVSDQWLAQERYYASQPTVKPESYYSSTPSLVGTDSSGGTNSRTNSSGDVKPDVASLQAQADQMAAVTGEGYIDGGSLNSGVTNMTGDTGTFHGGQSFMNLRLPEKKRKFSQD